MEDNNDSNFQLRRKCWRKKGWWPTKKAAHQRAKEIEKRSGVKMYAYNCGACGLVHLTKDASARGKGVI